MACGVESGIGVSCEDLKRVAGVNKRVWLFNMNDLQTPIDVTQSTITNINLESYALLYKFEGQKFSHSAGCKLVRTDSGNVSFEHSVNMRINNTTSTEDAVIEDLSVAEVGVIVQTNNNEFLIYGAGNGLTLMEMEDNTGQKQGDEEITMLKLVGAETTLPKRFARPAGSQGSILNETLYYLNAISNSNITS